LSDREGRLARRPAPHPIAKADAPQGGPRFDLLARLGEVVLQWLSLGSAEDVITVVLMGKLEIYKMGGR
jgi:hypothetical protein